MATISNHIWWCLHCEQTFISKRQPYRCKNHGCDGSFVDIRKWRSIREMWPEYPEIPVPGTVYGLYGDIHNGGE